MVLWLLGIVEILLLILGLVGLSMLGRSGPPRVTSPPTTRPAASVEACSSLLAGDSPGVDPRIVRC